MMLPIGPRKQPAGAPCGRASHACGRQQSAKQPTIGYLGSSTALTQSQWTAAFSKRLRELGWIEGRNVAIDYR
jgi:hypothetical protein